MLFRESVNRLAGAPALLSSFLISMKGPRPDIPEYLAGEISSRRPLSVFECDRFRISVFRGNRKDRQRRLLLEFYRDDWEPLFAVHETQFHKIVGVILSSSLYLRKYK